MVKPFLRLFVVIAAFLLLFSSCSSDEPIPEYDPDKLQVTLMFHLNQDLVPYALAGDHISYERLISTLLEFPKLPVQIHISGTLLHMLLWSESPTPALIMQGVESGQFELLLSTYSQNIIAATADSLLNQVQVEFHRELLKHVFDTEPSGFWNAERVWTDDVATFIVGTGAQHATVEKHILTDAGVAPDDHRTWNYVTQNGSLNIIKDDTDFLDRVNHVLNTGETDPLDEYLRKLKQNPKSGEFLIGYYEDAEAAGLWQYERADVHPDTTMNRLRELLTYFSESDIVQLTSPSRFFEHVTPTESDFRIPDGEASWMTSFSESMGYENWFDYFANNSTKRIFIDLFDELKPEIHEYHSYVDLLGEEHPARNLMRETMFHYAATSYELGASWFWTDDYAGFHRAKDTRMFLYGIEMMKNGEEGIFMKDINLDGSEEMVVYKDDQLIILQKEEARILYWFDLESGSVLLANSLTYDYEEQYMPGNRRMPELQGGTSSYTWLGDNAVLPEISEMGFRLRGTGPDLFVNDVLISKWNLNSHNAEQMTAEWESADSEKHVTLNMMWDEGLVFEWNIDHNNSNQSEYPVKIAQTFFPEPWQTLKYDPDGLSRQNIEDGFSITNNETGRGLSVIWDVEPAEITYSNILFGIREELRFSGDMDDDSAVKIRFRVFSGQF